MVPLLAFVFSALQMSFGAISVLDNDSLPTDWIVVYKLPKLRGVADPLASKGTGHIFLTPKSLGWERGVIGLDSPLGHSVGNTLAQYYTNKDKPESFFWVHYNDAKPKESLKPGEKDYKSGTGHAKGYLLFDETSGFWCVHSGPRFPGIDQYFWPPNLYTNGQTWLCVTYNVDQLPEITQQLIMNNVWAYNCNIPKSMEAVFPEFAEHCRKSGAIQDTQDIWRGTASKHAAAVEEAEVEAPIRRRRWPKRPRKILTEVDILRVAPLTSQAGVHLMSFAKNTKFQDGVFQDGVNDIWAALIAPRIGESFAVQGWLHTETGPNMPSNCTVPAHAIHNILQLKLAVGIDLVVDNYFDHSKWGCTENANNPWCCIGDINRQNGQIRRGGGFVCMKNAVVHSAFRSAIVKTEGCPIHKG